MSNDVIQDWTDTEVSMSCGDVRDVRYRIIKNGTRLFQEIRDPDGTLIYKQELPEGIPMKRLSFETSLRDVMSKINYA